MRKPRKKSSDAVLLVNRQVAGVFPYSDGMLTSLGIVLLRVQPIAEPKRITARGNTDRD